MLITDNQAHGTDPITWTHKALPKKKCLKAAQGRGKGIYHETTRDQRRSVYRSGSVAV
jgi:hypothetical protein